MLRVASIIAVILLGTSGGCRSAPPTSFADYRSGTAAVHGTPIAEVAYLTGFAEVSSFTRAVRRWFGCTPGQLRVERASGE